MSVLIADGKKEGERERFEIITYVLVHVYYLCTCTQVILDKRQMNICIIHSLTGNFC